MSHSKSQRHLYQASHPPIPLNHTLDHKLLQYATAASAAGVGILALTQLTQAEIVYTPTHQMVQGRGTIALDLNNDGTADFNIGEFDESCQSGPRCTLQGLTVSPVTDLNSILIGGNDSAFALLPGQNIGPGEKFGTYGRMEYCKATQTSVYSSGPWRSATSRYLGLAFSIEGQTHYAWARLSVEGGRRCAHTVVLTGYAYETEPGKPIVTGKTSGPEEATMAAPAIASLGFLALGSGGLVAWRRDENELMCQI